MAKMNTRCKVCGTVLHPEGEGVRICPSCKNASHDECWTHLGGCIDPNCRRAARGGAESQDTVSLGSRRQGALLRRRLAWILGQELGMAPDFHPDERKYAFATVICVLVTAFAGYRGITLLMQIFGPSALLLAGLLALHKRQRRKGLIHRWIPAGSAPEEALVLADWLLFVEGGGERGRPAPQFSEDFLAGDRDRRMFEDARRRKLLNLVSQQGEGKLFLGENGATWMQEARSRAIPEELTRA